MEEDLKNNPLKQLFNSANSVLVLLPPDPGQDLLSAGLSLHLSIKSSGKSSQIGCGSNLESYSQINGLNEVLESIGNKNLQITFDYLEQDLEKVDYEVSADGKFSLLIKPKSGSPVPDSHKVKFSYSGADADLVIAFGITSLEELGKFYADEKKFLDNAKILSVNTTSQEASYTANMFHLANTSFAELTCLLMKRVSLSLSPEAASNLLDSIFQNTDKLTSPRMTADTFSTISFLMKNGAKLPFQTIPFMSPNSPKPPYFEPPLSNPFLKQQPLQDPIPSDWKAPKIFRANTSDQPSN